MSDTPNISENNKSLKEQYVPFEERDSQKVTPIHFAKELAIFAAFTALGGVAGRFLGKGVEGKNIKLPKFMNDWYGKETLDRTVGTWVGGKIGGLYGIFHHWKKTEGKHLGVSAISSDLNTVLSSDTLEKDAKKQAEIIDGIETLHKLKSGSMSHVENVMSRREATANSLGKA